MQALRQARVNPLTQRHRHGDDVQRGLSLAEGHTAYGGAGGRFSANLPFLPVHPLTSLVM